MITIVHVYCWLLLCHYLVSESVIFHYQNELSNINSSLKTRYRILFYHFNCIITLYTTVAQWMLQGICYLEENFHKISKFFGVSGSQKIFVIFIIAITNTCVLNFFMVLYL